MLFNYRILVKVIGTISIIIGTAMLPSLMIAYLYDEKAAGMAFLKSILLAFTIGIVILVAVKPTSTILKMRDGYLIAALCWFIASAIGAFPYMFTEVMPSYGDAFFESVSGFTTTGATIIDDFSKIPKSVQFWRALSHWLGAMGILILAISLLPALGIGGLKLLSAETPSPTVEKMGTRISDTAKKLYLIYLTLTVIEVILLLLGGLNLFEALVHTFGSMGTGGMSNYSSSVAQFDNSLIEFVVISFSFLASINFVLYHQLLEGKWKTFLADRELRTFVAILIISFLLITLNLWLSGTYDSFGKALRFAVFQATAFMTTSAYATADYTLWPSFSQMMLICLMLIGGCSASACGSMKVIRFLILFKLVIRGTYKRLHPNAVVPVKIGLKTISAETVSKVSSFAILYFSILIVGCLVVSIENHDMLTTVSAVISSLSNTGLGFGELGPTENFAIFSGPTRIFLSVLMIAGRLELFTIIMLISPSFWRAR
ncbi:MAG TPA: potassium transporter TrkG [Anaerovoracaceae bacterium]|nr:potassium transporter TrkG [Anaerovoracaceae bacterium]